MDHEVWHMYTDEVLQSKFGQWHVTYFCASLCSQQLSGHTDRTLTD